MAGTLANSKSSKQLPACFDSISAITVDGHKVVLRANIGCPRKRKQPVHWGPKGGPFEQSFFMDREQLPSEENNLLPPSSSLGTWPLIE